ncbi:ACP phosphodiesterase [Akkermansiaceae bacterium]|nr:ACP phosphodiesterase [Akkermansiaceae bacterium]
MNYLAHLLLADDTDASRIGNLLGDFTRGSLDDLAEIYPAELVRGIKMHRAVDRFTDSHDTFRDARSLLDPSRSRFAGIIIDIFYDHYLCLHWDKFSSIKIADFTQQVYQALEENPSWQAGRLAEIFPSMKSTNWLMNYGSLDGIEHTLLRMSQRSPRIGKIAYSIIDLKDNYDDFESLFLKFMPELITFSTEWKKENP